MKNFNRSIALILVVFCFSSQAQKPSTSIVNETELMKKIEGEWIVMTNWKDEQLSFTIDNNEKEDKISFPHYNTIVFNEKNSLVEVYTYGEFMCGTAASQDLDMFTTKWRFVDNQLNIKGKYSDYSGEHVIDNCYDVERKESTLILKLID